MVFINIYLKYTFLILRNIYQLQFSCKNNNCNNKFILNFIYICFKFAYTKLQNSVFNLQNIYQIGTPCSLIQIKKIISLYANKETIELSIFSLVLFQIETFKESERPGELWFSQGSDVDKFKLLLCPGNSACSTNSLVCGTCSQYLKLDDVIEIHTIISFWFNYRVLEKIASMYLFYLCYIFSV